MISVRCNRYLIAERLITNQPTTRDPSAASAPDVMTVDTGVASPEKRPARIRFETLLPIQNCNAWSGNGPGVFHERRTHAAEKSVPAPSAGPVRRGILRGGAFVTGRPKSQLTRS